VASSSLTCPCGTSARAAGEGAIAVVDGLIARQVDVRIVQELSIVEAKAQPRFIKAIGFHIGLSIICSATKVAGWWTLTRLIVVA
jgi:hypothetical protein